MDGEVLKTNIDGLIFRMNKVVGDARGVLCEFAPKGFEDELLSGGVRGIYASIATQKGIARAGHYHKKKIENFYTISGTALWLFIDIRNESFTNGNVYGVIVGFTKPTQSNGLPIYTIDQGNLANFVIPPGVYHMFVPISDEKSIVVCLASESYDKLDYFYPDISTIPEAKKILDDFQVTLQ